MKYVRTKEDKIIKIDENGCVKEFNMFGKKTLFAFRDKNYSYRFENGKEIIKQSETIEELCDEFVFDDKRNNEHYLIDYDDVIDEIYCGRIYEEDVIYGAIWTDKGLQYVAKMNDKGELELI